MVEFFCECGIERKVLIIDLDNLVDWIVNFYFKDEFKKVNFIKIFDICYKVLRNIKKK